MDTIPVKELVLNDVEGESGTKTLAFVDRPAISLKAVYFKDQPQYKAAFYNEERGIIVSPALIPGQYIERYHPVTKEPFAVFMSRETIFEVNKRWMKEGRANYANEMHDGVQVDGVVWFNSMVSDEVYFKNPEEWKDLPVGTWFLMGHITNEDIKAKFRDQTYTGISIEGIFDMLDSRDLTPEQINATTESILGF